MKPGDKVICIKSHPWGLVLKGQTFTVIGTFKCFCGELGIDVGVKLTEKIYRLKCYCGIRILYNGIVFIGARRFRRIDKLLNSDEIEAIIEEKIDTEIPEIIEN